MSEVLSEAVSHGMNKATSKAPTQSIQPIITSKHANSLRLGNCNRSERSRTPRPNNWVFGLLALSLAACLPAATHAQFPQAPEVPQPMLDSPALKPPAGANVAIVEFADLECPACRVANPTVAAAAAKYKVPWIFHDFPIPGHVWSQQAAVNARWFGEKAKPLAEEYRNAVYVAQMSLSTTDDLNQFTQKFAQDHKIQLPFMIDPQGKLMDGVRADANLARSLGINRTPTIFVVTAHSHDPGHPFVQMLDAQLLYASLDQAISATTNAKPAPAAATHKSHGTR